MIGEVDQFLVIMYSTPVQILKGSEILKLAFDVIHQSFSTSIQRTILPHHLCPLFGHNFIGRQSWLPQPTSRFIRYGMPSPKATKLSPQQVT